MSSQWSKRVPCYLSPEKSSSRMPGHSQCICVLILCKHLRASTSLHLWDGRRFWSKPGASLSLRLEGSINENGPPYKKGSGTSQMTFITSLVFGIVSLVSKVGIWKWLTDIRALLDSTLNLSLKAPPGFVTFCMCYSTHRHGVSTC